MHTTEEPDRLVYYPTAERPDLEVWLLDADDSLIDFSSGYTFEFKLGPPGDLPQPAVFTKSNGITGAVGSGTDLGGEPNVVIAFTPGELDDVPAGLYLWQLRATTSGLDRIYQGHIDMRGVLT